MRKQTRLLAVMMSFMLFLTTLPITASAADPGGWQFNALGSSTSSAKNPDRTVNADGSVTLKAVNSGGKITGPTTSPSEEGMSFYYKQIDLPANANFEIHAKAKVVNFSGTSSPDQSSFGLMLRGNVGTDSTKITSNYVAVGGFGVKATTTSPIIAAHNGLQVAYKTGSTSSTPGSTNGTVTRLAEFSGINTPTPGEVYDLSIKKSGDAYALTVNGKSEKIALNNLFANSLYAGKLYAGFYVARDAEATFSNFDIKVDTRSPSSLKLDTASLKTDYFVSESLDFTGLVTAVYADGHEEILKSSDYIITGFDNTKPGSNSVTVNFNGVTTAAVNMTVNPLSVTSMGIKYYPAKTNYYPGEKFDSQGLVVIGEYNSGAARGELASDQYTISVSGASVTGTTYTLNSFGTKTVTIRSTVTASTFTTFDISVKNVQLTGLEVRQLPQKTTYYIGDTFVPDGMVVYAKYSDNSEVRLMRNEYTVSSLDTSTAGSKQLTVNLISDSSRTASLNITVKQKQLAGIQVTKYPKTTYQTGESFDSTGLEVSSVYDSTYKELLPANKYTVDASSFDKTKAGTYDIKIKPVDTTVQPITLKTKVREPVTVQWKSIRFGQSSSDANNKVTVKDDGTVQVVALEGGGKVTGDHDGIAFYYTELDATKDNFVLSANIKVVAYAKDPYDGQESFGIMARDAIGTPGDSSVFASNIAAIGGYSGGTKNLNATQLFVRTGVTTPDGAGSKGVKNIPLNSDKPTTSNTFPAAPYKLTLTKTNSGFTGKLNSGTEEMIFAPDIMTVQDSKMYVGFYAARLATIEVSAIDLKVTAAETDAPKVDAPPQQATPDVQFVSLDKTSKTSYSLGVKSNVNGTVSLKQDQSIIAQDRAVEAGKVLTLNTTVTANTYTNFSAAFVPDDTQYLTDYSKLVKNFTVDMKTYADNGDIYVAPSPKGTSSGLGTAVSPLDLDTAIAYVREGQKILMLDGNYVRSSKVEIKKGNDGTANAKKYLFAAPGAKPVIDFNKKSEGVVLSGNYWHVKGIDFTRSADNSKGFTVGGSYNTVELSRFYANGDTGLQISSTDGSSDKSTWPSYNLILNNESFDNVDPANNNADGFAAKLTSGTGNVFRGDISHNNIDDGWDLYTKAGSGAIGSVIIENSIAYNNGTLTNGLVGAGDKNGFKLGGEGIHVPHIIRNSIAFGNGAYGFSSNSNPGVRVESNNISFNNAKGNLNLSTYTGIPTDFRLDGFVSYQKDYAAKDNYPAALDSATNFMFNGSFSVNTRSLRLSDSNFASLTPKLPYQRDAEGNIILGDFLKFFAPKENNHSGGTGGSGTGTGGGEAPTTPQATNNGPQLSLEPQKSTVDGKTAALVSVDAATLSKAIELLTANSAKITLEVKGTEQLSIVQLPASSITEAASKVSNAILSIKANGITYDLPVKALDVSGLAKALGAEAKDVKINITIEKISGEAAAAMDTNAKKNGVTMLAGAFEFNITAEANGKKVTVNDFGNTYIARTFEVSGSIDTNKAGGVMYNPATGAMTFVPTKFTTTGNSITVTLMRPGNSIYTVVQADKTFADLGGHWSKADVELLASKLLVNGATDTTFAPQNQITRAEFAALLVRATGLTEEATTKFSDVKAADWFAGAIGAASKAGLVDGFENGAFQPGATITREQMAVMIARAVLLAGKKSDSDAKKLTAFEDNSRISGWAKDAVAGAVNAGIVNGITDKTFAPSGQATRAEAAVMLKRFLQFTEFMN